LADKIDKAQKRINDQEASGRGDSGGIDASEFMLFAMANKHTKADELVHQSRLFFALKSSAKLMDVQEEEAVDEANSADLMSDEVLAQPDPFAGTTPAPALAARAEGKGEEEEEEEEEDKEEEEEEKEEQDTDPQVGDLVEAPVAAGTREEEEGKQKDEQQQQQEEEDDAMLVVVADEVEEKEEAAPASSKGAEAAAEGGEKKGVADERINMDVETSSATISPIVNKVKKGGFQAPKQVAVPMVTPAPSSSKKSSGKAKAAAAGTSPSSKGGGEGKVVEKKTKKASKSKGVEEGGEKKKKDKDKPKRGKTAYNIYSGEQTPLIKQSDPHLKFGEINKLIGGRWALLSADEKKPYEEDSERDKETQKLLLAEYFKKNPDAEVGEKRKAKAPTKGKAGKKAKTSKVSGKKKRNDDSDVSDLDEEWTKQEASQEEIEEGGSSAVATGAQVEQGKGGKAMGADSDEESEAERRSRRRKTSSSSSSSSSVASSFTTPTKKQQVSNTYI